MKSVCNEFDAMPVFVVTGDENEIKDKVSFISSMEAWIIFNKVKNYDELKEFAEENGVEVMCYAEYIGEPISMLEARRKELYEKCPIEKT